MDQPLISIVDDDEAVCRAIRGLVRSLGYQALTFNSAEDFLASQAAFTSNCIISDIQMPGLSGLEMKQKLNEQSCMTPMIMITARLEPHVDDDVRRSGALFLIRKPFEAAALIECLERALAKKC